MFCFWNANCILGGDPCECVHEMFKIFSLFQWCSSDNMSLPRICTHERGRWQHYSQHYMHASAPRGYVSSNELSDGPLRPVPVLNE